MTNEQREKLKRMWRDFVGLTFPTQQQAQEWWLDRMGEEVKAERERINQFFADKADYDTESDCTIISDRVYHKAFNPNGCASDGQNGNNLCTDCYNK